MVYKYNTTWEWRIETIDPTRPSTDEIKSFLNEEIRRTMIEEFESNGYECNIESVETHHYSFVKTLPHKIDGLNYAWKLDGKTSCTYTSDIAIESISILIIGLIAKIIPYIAGILIAYFAYQGFRELKTIIVGWEVVDGKIIKHGAIIDEEGNVIDLPDDEGWGSTIRWIAILSTILGGAYLFFGRDKK